jgi:hypothetical protein
MHFNGAFLEDLRWDACFALRHWPAAFNAHGFVAKCYALFDQPADDVAADFGGSAIDAAFADLYSSSASGMTSSCLLSVTPEVLGVGF